MGTALSENVVGAPARPLSSSTIQQPSRAGASSTPRWRNSAAGGAGARPSADGDQGERSSGEAVRRVGEAGEQASGGEDVSVD